MESKQETTSFKVVRVDRITFAKYPHCDDIQDQGQARLIADRETKAHLPLGDKFVVTDTHDTVLYEPD